MKKRCSEEQIIQILREAEKGGNHIDICRKYAISEPTFYYWRRRYQGINVPELQKLKLLESEHARLKRLVAEQALAIQGLQEVLKKRGLL